MSTEHHVNTPLGYDVYRDGVLVERHLATFDGQTIAFIDGQEPIRVSSEPKVETGGFGLIARKSLLITDDQIKALATSSVELVPAPGPNKAILVLDGFCDSDFTAGEYEFEGQGNVVLILGNSYNQDAACSTTISYLSQQAAMLIPIYQLQSSSLREGTVDQPLTISTTASSITGGGNEANTLRVIIHYAIIDLTQE